MSHIQEEDSGYILNCGTSMNNSAILFDEFNKNVKQYIRSAGDRCVLVLACFVDMGSGCKNSTTINPKWHDTECVAKVCRITCYGKSGKSGCVHCRRASAKMLGYCYAGRGMSRIPHKAG